MIPSSHSLEGDPHLVKTNSEITVSLTPEESEVLEEVSSDHIIISRPTAHWILTTTLYLYCGPKE